MAAPTVLTNATIWYGGYDLTGATNEITMSAARAEKPVSRFGDTIEATYPGATTVGVEAKGFWDSALDGPQFTQLTNPSTSWPLTICPDGADVGEVAYGIEAYSFNYSALESQWGQSLPYRLSAKSQSGGRLGRGRVMIPKATYTTSATTAKYQIGAVSATQKLIATLHVFDAVTGTWNFSNDSDADATAGGETGRGSFVQVAAASGPTQQVIEIAGPITDTYWRVNRAETVAGSITCAVTLTIVDA